LKGKNRFSKGPVHGIIYDGAPLGGKLGRLEIKLWEVFEKELPQEETEKER